MRLLEVTTHPQDIPERLRELDPTLRVFFNPNTQKYEVWGTDVSMEDYCVGEFCELDARVITAVRKGIWLMNNKVRPWMEFLAEIRRNNRKLGEDLTKRLRELEEDAADAFKYFGTTLYPGWSGADEIVGVDRPSTS